MLRLSIRRLPIVDHVRLAGIISEKDLTRCILQVFYEPAVSPEIKSLIRSKQFTL